MKKHNKEEKVKLKELTEREILSVSGGGFVENIIYILKRRNFRRASSKDIYFG